MKRHFKSALAFFMPLFVLSCLTLTSGYILSSSLSGAVEPEDEDISASVHVMEACSVAADSLNHSVSTVGGGVTTLGTTTFEVSCNDRDGYSLYAVGYGNKTVGNTNLTGANTGQTIPTGTDMSANVSNWAMRLTAVNYSTYFVPTILSDTNGSFTENHVVPSTDTKVVTFKNAINVSKPSRFTATYTVATTFAQAPDTYTGQVRYTLFHPNYTNADGTTESYPVTLAFNDAESIVIDGTTFTASSATPSLTYGTHTISGTYPSGYEFDSWSSTGSISIASTSTASTTMTVSGAGALTLNAKSSCQTSVNGTMQAFNPCSSIAIGTTGTLTDSRGDTPKSYTVAKLADGKWWMASNLDLPGETTLSQSDSNLNGSTTSYTLPASSASGFSSYSTAYVYNSGRTTCSDSSTGSCYSYYSYVAATAGTSPSSGAASSDICPYGWRLPTQAEYNTLKGTYTTGATLTASPFYGVYSGYYSSDSFYSGGGHYWSSTAGDKYGAYGLYFDSGSAYTYGGSKSYGLAVRCVAKS